MSHTLGYAGRPPSALGLLARLFSRGCLITTDGQCLTVHNSTMLNDTDRRELVALKGVIIEALTQTETF